MFFNNAKRPLEIEFLLNELLFNPAKWRTGAEQRKCENQLDCTKYQIKYRKYSQNLMHMERVYHLLIKADTRIPSIIHLNVFIICYCVRILISLCILCFFFIVLVIVISRLFAIAAYHCLTASVHIYLFLSVCASLLYASFPVSK